jgi:hypothetical protein
MHFILFSLLVGGARRGDKYNNIVGAGLQIIVKPCTRQKAAPLCARPAAEDAESLICISISHCLPMRYGAPEPTSIVSSAVCINLDFQNKC